jgi:hypothetical protein
VRNVQRVSLSSETSIFRATLILRATLNAIEPEIWRLTVCCASENATQNDCDCDCGCDFDFGLDFFDPEDSSSDFVDRDTETANVDAVPKDADDSHLDNLRGVVADIVDRIVEEARAFPASGLM